MSSEAEAQKKNKNKNVKNVKNEEIELNAMETLAIYLSVIQYRTKCYLFSSAQYLTNNALYNKPSWRVLTVYTQTILE